MVEVMVTTFPLDVRVKVVTIDFEVRVGGTLVGVSVSGMVDVVKVVSGSS